jgi:Putative bacterial sensory transduction regulator
MADEIVDPQRFAEVEQLIATWLAELLRDNPVIAAVERIDDGDVRWFARIKGETKDVYSIWFTLRQRSLHFETYVMPAPEENQAAFHEHLLRRNRKLHGLSFCIGEEDAVFLAGALPIHAIDEGELDRILGSFYAYVEQCFLPALRIGFASRFA